MAIYRYLVAAFIGVAGLFVATLGQAFQFTPFSETMRPTGKKNSTYFAVINEGNTPIAVQITLKKRQMREDGEDVLTDCDDDFLIFPPQIIAQPNSTRKIRVQWVGKPDVTDEQSYRLIAEQLPINLERLEQGQGAQVQVMLRYVASLYVQPEGAKSNVVVRSITRGNNAKGQPVLKITVENLGNRHTLLEDVKLTIGGIVLTKEDLPGFADNNVLAHVKRTFEVPVPAKLPSNANLNQAELTYRESF